MAERHVGGGGGWQGLPPSVQAQACPALPWLLSMKVCSTNRAFQNPIRNTDAGWWLGGNCMPVQSQKSHGISSSCFQQVDGMG